MPANACIGCASGSKHDVELKGTETVIHGLQTYVAIPPSTAPTSKVIVIVPDAFGWDFTNNRSLADQWATEGYLVYIPDFMQGAPLSTELLEHADVLEGKPVPITQKLYSFYKLISNGGPFLYRTRRAVTMPIVEKFFTALRENEGKTMKVGVAGFCWGAGYTLAMVSKTSTREPLADAAFMAHPSNIDRNDFLHIVNPLSIAVGDADSQMKLPLQAEAKEVMEKENANVPFQMEVMPGAKHGFVIRYDMHDQTETAQADAARKQALDWFGKYLR